MSQGSTAGTGQELVRDERGRFRAGGPSANPGGRPKRSTAGTGQELVRDERGRFRAGGPSANPGGRSKRGQSIAELVRRETDWHKLRTRLEHFVHDPKTKPSDAIQAAIVLLDRGYGKPDQAHRLEVTRDDADETDLSHLSLDELRAALAEREAWERRWLSPRSAVDDVPAQLPGREDDP
jgi:hypothetical protein